jgi:hypothetical protein
MKIAIRWSRVRLDNAVDLQPVHQRLIQRLRARGGEPGPGFLEFLLDDPKFEPSETCDALAALLDRNLVEITGPTGEQLGNAITAAMAVINEKRAHAA